VGSHLDALGGLSVIETYRQLTSPAPVKCLTDRVCVANLSLIAPGRCGFFGARSEHDLRWSWTSRKRINLVDVPSQYPLQFRILFLFQKCADLVLRSLADEGQLAVTDLPG
jgi:hypothetical protein